MGRIWLLGAMGRCPIRFFELLGAMGRSPAPPNFSAEIRINFLSRRNQQIPVKSELEIFMESLPKEPAENCTEAFAKNPRC